MTEFSSYYMGRLGSVYPNKVEETDRRVVVIDPEDREQARHLAHVVHTEIQKIPYVHDNYADEPTKAGQRALRSLVTPPKPPEPTGLGAVVEDADGSPWVRGPGDDGCRVWLPNGPMDPHRYIHIDAVKVLSEGVTP